MMHSLLFIPGNNPAMLQNAFIFNSGYVILDLEDAVLADEKDAARILVNEYLQTLDDLSRVIVRVNPTSSSAFAADMEMLSKYAIFAIMLPKSDFSALTNFTSKYAFQLVPIIETARGVIEIEKIVSNEQVVALLLGAEDLALDINVIRSSEGLEILYPRLQLVYYCAAYQKGAIDTPVVSINDNELLQADTEFAKQLGFIAKACIHPNQVSVVNAVYAYSKEEYEWAMRVITMKEQHNVAGAFNLDGKMIDEPIVKRAYKIVADVKSNGVRK